MAGVYGRHCENNTKNLGLCSTYTGTSETMTRWPQWIHWLRPSTYGNLRSKWTEIRIVLNPPCLDIVGDVDIG